QLFFRAFLQQRTERRRTLREARLEQTARYDLQVVAARQRVAKTHRLGVARGNGLVAGRAEAREDGVDERIRMACPDAERVARLVGDAGARKGDDLMPGFLC